MLLDGLRQFLKEGAGRSPTVRTGDDHRRKGAQSHRLQHLLRDDHLLRALATGLRRRRDPDRIADTLLQHDRHCRRGSDDSLRAHACLGQAQVQGIVTGARSLAVDGDQILHAGHLAREHDPVAG